MRISNTVTSHGTLLGWDQIHHYATDPDQGDGHGFLILNTQISIGGDSLWCEPTFRPGMAIPDHFREVRGWKRENDPLYLQNLNAPPALPSFAPASLQNESGNAALFLCICAGIFLLSANS